MFQVFVNSEVHISQAILHNELKQKNIQKIYSVVDFFTPFSPEQNIQYICLCHEIVVITLSCLKLMHA